MQNAEKYKFIDEELKGLWPEWKPTEAETRVWLGILSNYDYKTARTSIQQYFTDQGGNYRRPKPAGFTTKANVIQQKKAVHKEWPTVMTIHYIECIGGPERNPKLEGARKGVFTADKNNQDDPDYVLACAETMRERYEYLYGGKWIIVKVKPAEDSGLRGEAAREKAFDDILSGPGCKTKRWLQKYIEEHKKPTERKESKQPVLVGAVLDDEIPF